MPIMLSTPITLGGETYNALVIVAGRFDLQKQYAEAHLALAKVTTDKVILGVRDLGKTPIQVRFNRPFRTLTFEYDPKEEDSEALQELKRQFLSYLGLFEALILTRKNDPGGLLSIPLEVGTAEYSLDGTYSAVGTRTVELEDIGGD